MGDCAPIPDSAKHHLLDLEATALLAFRHGSHRAGPHRDRVPPTDWDARVSRAYEARLAVEFAPFEIDVLRRATRCREDGLALCRSGHVAEGAIRIGAAREMVEGHLDNPEALRVAHSFQYAAEAYVKYKGEEWGAATACLIAALRCCRELNDVWGYPVEGRRIHLVCNLARTAARAGNNAEAARLTASMLNRLDAGDGFWPYPELDLRAPGDRLLDTESWLLADQALSVVAMVADRAEPNIRRSLSADFPLAVSAGGRIARARTWVDGVVAYADDDIERFLLRCSEFFTDGPGLLSVAWSEMVRRFSNHLLAEAHSSSARASTEPGSSL